MNPLKFSVLFFLALTIHASSVNITVTNVSFYNLDISVSDWVLATEGGLLIDYSYYNYANQTQTNVEGSLYSLCADLITSVQGQLYCADDNDNSQLLQVIPQINGDDSVTYVKNKTISTTSQAWNVGSYAFSGDYAVSVTSDTDAGTADLVAVDLPNSSSSGSSWVVATLNTTKGYQISPEDQPAVGITNMFVSYSTFYDDETYQFWAYDISNKKSTLLGNSTSQDIDQTINALIVNSGQGYVFHQYTSGKQPTSTIYSYYMASGSSSIQAAQANYSGKATVFGNINDTYFTMAYPDDSNSNVQVVGLFTVSSDDGSLKQAAVVKIPSTPFKFQFVDKNGQYNYVSDSIMLSINIDNFDVIEVSDISKDFVVPPYTLANGSQILSTSRGLITLNDGIFSSYYGFPIYSYYFYYDDISNSVWYASQNNENDTCQLTRMDIGLSQLSVINGGNCQCEDSDNQNIQLESIQLNGDDFPNIVYSCIGYESEKSIYAVINGTNKFLYSSDQKDILFGHFDDGNLTSVAKSGNNQFDITSIQLDDGSKGTPYSFQNAQAVAKIDDATLIVALQAEGESHTGIYVQNINNGTVYLTMQLNYVQVTNIVPVANSSIPTRVNGFYVIGGSNSTLYYHTNDNRKVVITDGLSATPIQSSIIGPNLLILRDTESIDYGTVYTVIEIKKGGFLVTMGLGIIVALMIALLI